MLLQLLRHIARRPVSVILSVGVVLFVGGLSLVNIPVEIKPDQTGQGILIRVRWGKFPPETVQQLITRPIEDEVIQLRDVSSVESSSGIGRSEIRLRYPKNIDMKYAYIELREHLSRIRTQLPENINLLVEPLFNEESDDYTFKEAFVEVELIGPHTLNELRRFAREIVKPQLMTVDGIARIDIIGGADGFLRVKLDRSRLSTLGLNEEMIWQKIRNSAVNRGLGFVLDSGNTYSILLDNRPRDISDWGKIPITGHLLLKDISEIRLAYDDPVSVSRHNYNPLVLVQILKTPGVNALSLSASLRNKINDIQRVLPSSTYLRIAADSSDMLRDELRSLLYRTAVIFIVVFGILFLLFRRWILSGVILLVTLMSVITAATMLYWTGYTINVVTLAGMALVFGMLVDNAVVVLENIQRYRHLGRSPDGSGLRGTLEVFQPLLASTATTVLVFFSLLVLQDRLGAHYKPLAYVLGFSLIASLIVALLLIPALVIHWPRLLADPNRPRSFTRLKDRYRMSLHGLIRRPKLSLGAMVMLLGFTFWIFWQNVEKGGFFTWGGEEKIRVYISAPRGVRFDVLDNMARNFEAVMRRESRVDNVRTVVDENRHYVWLSASFADSIRHTVIPLILKENLIAEAVNYAGVGIGISGFGMPYWNGGYRISTMYNTQLKITGPDYYRLYQIGESILDLAKMDPRVNEGVISPSQRGLWESDAKEIRMITNVDKLWDQRLSLEETRRGIADLLLNYAKRKEIFLQNRRSQLQLLSSDKYPDLTTVKNEYFRIPNGRRLSLDKLFQIEKLSIQPWIDKKDQQYRFTVAWQYRGPERMRSHHEKSIVEAIQLPHGYVLEKQQWGFLTQKEEGDLLKLLLWVTVGAFMILAALYESFWKPFVIFFTVPFALIGVFVAYVLFDREFNVNGYIGLILLLGIILNNGIVLVDRINQLRTQNRSLIEAVIQGCLERIRPIMITTLTTIGGLIPLFFLPSGDTTMAKILSELSFITIGGLIGSTLFTISMIPIVYYVIASWREKTRANGKRVLQ